MSPSPVQKYDHIQESQKSSYEQVPLHTACFTYLGFYLLMILGYINQLFFTPKVATEKHRDVSVELRDSVVLCAAGQCDFMWAWNCAKLCSVCAPGVMRGVMDLC